MAKRPMYKTYTNGAGKKIDVCQPCYRMLTTPDALMLKSD